MGKTTHDVPQWVRDKENEMGGIGSMFPDGNNLKTLSKMIKSGIQDGEYQIAIRYDNDKKHFVGILKQLNIGAQNGVEYWNVITTLQNESYPLLSHDMLKGGWFKLLKP